MTAPEQADRPEARKARELNEQLLYTMYAVFRASTPLPEDRVALVAEAQSLLDAALGKDVYTRGTYDVSGYRADADLLIWWTCPDPDVLQETYARFRQTTLGRHLSPTWSAVGVHRPAEFNRNHIPAYVRREDPKRYVCVYPFNRSLEWYLLPDVERKGMLSEHGIMGREFEDVRANTVAAFGLGDYEWLLAFEADQLHRIVDCLRHLRGSRARRHAALETPFFTGPSKPLAELVSALP
ncbi:MAG TPA: hydrogen peroxide-dependent heme synthase [Mycobacteriales bacterium]|nr:hydrogen peroxide-dependent heme synthase [Mycobacteriales bacterium]